MKRALVVLTLAVALVAMTSRSWAATTATITVSVLLQPIIGVSVTPDTWSIPAVTLGSVAGPTTFTAQIQNADTSLTIAATDPAAGGWRLGPTGGADQFAVTATVTNPLRMVTLTTSHTSLVLVPYYGSKNFALRYYAPTSDTEGGGKSQNFTVILKAQAPTP